MNGTSESLLPIAEREEEVKLRTCIYNLAIIAAPQVVSMVLNYLPQTINVLFISRLGDADMLAAVGLANLVFNIGGVSCGYGINQAIETLVSQSRGNSGHRLASIHMAKGMCIGLLLSTILFIVLQFTEIVLKFLGQDPVVARHAMDYQHSMYAIKHRIDGMSVEGTLVLPIGYTIISYTSRCSTNIHSEYVLWMVGIPQDWYTFYDYLMLRMIVGLLQDSAQLAAHVSVCNVSVLMFMVSYGLQAGLSAKIGAAVGSGNLYLARMYCKCATLMGGCMLVVIELTLITFRSTIASFYAAREPEVSGYLTVLIFPYLGIQEVFDFAQACMQGVFKGLGIQRYAAVVNLCSYYLCMLPLGYLLCIHFELGVYGMWMAFIVSVAGVASSYSIILRSTDWSKHMDAAHVRIKRAL
ncbi:multidrug resistance pump, putative [Perkinsus marinus ATCC 50983]|uniref:Multidrug resistance pump, putative n=1 Tax=Perkinsus marinus (strain ATCC 50983 / TXsc) TaxID=423536 RepID=C5L4C2_PERM5|nr:multidrug resistance pump, putative [Perkinsus marinus ATCC 50983]EER08359.1 multidrug resistance pump, putative [Perkinsus marinus ATCC 50983]|eukprot:XP_002776543.1 multidrug resistance pump, putative [Perkinsus marinus ATCC 50983]